jgi:hypothetical protein
MSKLYQSTPLACPYNRARDLLAETLEPLAKSGQPWVLNLRAPLVGEGLDLAKEVVVTVGTATDPLHFDQIWSIHWHPVEGGAYPDFQGTITIRADQTYKTSLLELQGEYEPPFGAVGAAFDAVLGARVASATARELLRSFGSKIESAYFETEHAKKEQREAIG